MVKKRRLVIFPALMPIIVMGAFMVFGGCYVINQAIGLHSYLRRAEPIERVIEDPGTDGQVLLLLERVVALRSYCSEDLGLTPGKNYTKIVQIDRNYIAAVVSACSAIGFERHYWNYPIVGRMPYRGYFNPEAARREAERMRDRGYDVYLRPVRAFSTLGYFTDPLYSFMADYSHYDLANLIIHESVHATVHIKNSSQFNENLATFIGDTGARLYMKSLGLGAETAEMLRQRERNSAAFREQTAELRRRLQALYDGYDGGSGEEERARVLAEKERIIAEFQREYLENYEDLFIGDGYRWFGDENTMINNALLDLYALYEDDNTLFERIYASFGGDGNPAALREMVEHIGDLHKEHGRRAAHRIEELYPE